MRVCGRRREFSAARETPPRKENSPLRKIFREKLLTLRDFWILCTSLAATKARKGDVLTGTTSVVSAAPQGAADEAATKISKKIRKNS